MYVPGVEKRMELQVDRGFEVCLPNNLSFPNSTFLSSQEDSGCVSPDVGLKKTHEQRHIGFVATSLLQWN